MVTPPPVDRQMDGQTRVKTLPSRRTTYAGGKHLNNFEDGAFAFAFFQCEYTLMMHLHPVTKVHRSFTVRFGNGDASERSFPNSQLQEMQLYRRCKMYPTLL